MWHSIAEASKLTGLSKVSLYKKIKLKEFKSCVIVEKGKTLVNDEFISLLTAVNNDTEKVKSEFINTEDKQGSSESKTSYERELINLLTEQLRLKDEQISELNARLADQQEIMRNAQVLQLGQQEVKLIDVPGPDQQEGQHEQPKRRFFNFGRKK